LRTTANEAPAIGQKVQRHDALLKQMPNSCGDLALLQYLDRMLRAVGAPDARCRQFVRRVDRTIDG
jgi:hypothetical protein